MNIRSFYNILAIVLGFGLIIGGFIVFGQDIEQCTRTLDIVVACLVYYTLVQFAVFPLIDRSQSAHREVGMMGLHFGLMAFYDAAAVAVIVVGLLLEWPFTVQLFVQLGLLAVLLFGRAATLLAGSKVRQVHADEKALLSTRDALRSAMDSFMDNPAIGRNLPEQAVSRLAQVSESIRYVSPSASQEARSLEARFVQSLAALEAMAADPAANAQRIDDEITMVERTLNRRKNVKS